MRVARIATSAGATFSVQGIDDTWVPLPALGLALDTTAEVASRMPEIEDKAKGALGGIAQPQFLSPIVRPSKILAVGLNYMDHIAEQGGTTPEFPIVFAKFPNSIAGPTSDVMVDPGITTWADYEVELAIVIGQRSSYLREEEALTAVFGYTVANDISARDLQRRDSQLSRSKSFDTFCPLGPWITTADKVPDPGVLRIRSWVNDELRQDSSTAAMIFSVPYLVSYLSHGITLEPGDVILTGTPDGVGAFRDPPTRLEVGDVVTCEVEGLGKIVNRVVRSS